MYEEYGIVGRQIFENRGLRIVFIFLFPRKLYHFENVHLEDPEKLEVNIKMVRILISYSVVMADTFVYLGGCLAK